MNENKSRIGARASVVRPPAEARRGRPLSVAKSHFASHVGADYGRPVFVFAFARVAAGACIPHRARLFSSWTAAVRACPPWRAALHSSRVSAPLRRSGPMVALHYERPLNQHRHPACPEQSRRERAEPLRHAGRAEGSLPSPTPAPAEARGGRRRVETMVALRYE